MLWLVGCGAPEPVGALRSALFVACNGDGDCSGIPVGAAMVATCNVGNHTCTVAQKGGVQCTGTGDCNDANTCTNDSCNVPSGVCSNLPTGNSGCCLVDGDCPAATNSCQTRRCNQSQCGYVAAAGNTCCNLTPDCGGTATCDNNVCSCASGKFCPGGSLGSGVCGACCGDNDCAPRANASVTCNLASHTCSYTCSGGFHDCGGTCADNTSTQSCGASCSPCPTGNSCQNATCNGASCGLASTGASGCCTSGPADCGPGVSCVMNTCTCGTNQKFCPGGGASMGFCVSTNGCCSTSDCTPHSNAMVNCNMSSHTCVYSCNTGFHDCSGICKSNMNVNSCGALCNPCPMGNSCQTTTCSGTLCGFVAAGPSPCCNAKTDCTPNSCQTVGSCIANRCSFVPKIGTRGCCNTPSDCPKPSNPACYDVSCVDNQCVDTLLPGCTEDGGTPVDGGSADMGAPEPGADLAAPGQLSLTGGGGCGVAGSDGGAGTACALVVAFTLASWLRRRRAA
jgi:hypothetical protein